MEIACIGDIHGSPRWREVKEIDCDHYVFVGDYVDSEEFSSEHIIHNLEEIIEFKLKHSDQVWLLLGNHDFQYINYPNFRCNGFRPELLESLQKIYSTYSHLFQVAQQFENYLFTHAGVTRSWVNKHVNDSAERLDEVLNFMAQSEAGISALSEVGIARGGKCNVGGPLWCDYHAELLRDPIPNLHQVVGHSRSKYLLHHDLAGINLWNVNYLAYSDEPIFILNINS